MAGNKDNMKQAMKELLGMVGIGPEGEEEATEPEVVAPQQEIEEAPAMNFLNDKPQPEPEYIPPVRPVVEAPRKPVQEPIFAPVPPPTSFTSRPVAAGSTVIAAGTVITGDIRCQGDVEFQGNLKGNLETTGNVRVTGKVLGDIKGTGIELVGCSIQGNITGESEIHLDQSAVVVGDMITALLSSDGKVKGNITAHKSANFQKNAVLVGDVSAGLLSMSEGAKIQGSIRVEMTSDNIPDFGVDMNI